MKLSSSVWLSLHLGQSHRQNHQLRHLKEIILWGNIAWSAMGKQNIQAKKEGELEIERGCGQLTKDTCTQEEPRLACVTGVSRKL